MVYPQKPTVIFVNGSLALGIALLLGSLSTGGLPNDLILHLSVLLSLMIGLIISFNWYVHRMALLWRSDALFDSTLSNHSDNGIL